MASHRTDYLGEAADTGCLQLGLQGGKCWIGFSRVGRGGEVGGCLSGESLTAPSVVSCVAPCVLCGLVDGVSMGDCESTMCYVSPRSRFVCSVPAARGVRAWVGMLARFS
eukprot:scaffold172135_cov45-Tisochrysis_lutea.AAC.1